MPRSAAASITGGSGAPVCGDPWCHASVNRGGCAAGTSYACSTEPSASRTSSSRIGYLPFVPGAA